MADIDTSFTKVPLRFEEDQWLPPGLSTEHFMADSPRGLPPVALEDEEGVGSAEHLLVVVEPELVGVPLVEEGFDLEIDLVSVEDGTEGGMSLEHQGGCCEPNLADPRSLLPGVGGGVGGGEVEVAHGGGTALRPLAREEGQTIRARNYASPIHSAAPSPMRA